MEKQLQKILGGSIPLGSSKGAYNQLHRLNYSSHTIIRAWCLFSRDHDVIKTGPEFLEQEGNILCVIQLTLRSALGVYDIRSR